MHCVELGRKQRIFACNIRLRYSREQPSKVCHVQIPKVKQNSERHSESESTDKQISPSYRRRILPLYFVLFDTTESGPAAKLRTVEVPVLAGRHGGTPVAARRHFRQIVPYFVQPRT